MKPTVATSRTRYFRSKSGAFIWRFQAGAGKSRVRAADDKHWMLSACTVADMRPEDELTEAEANELCNGNLNAPSMDMTIAEEALQKEQAQ